MADAPSPTPEEARVLRNLARREPVSENEARRRLDTIAALAPRAFDFDTQPAEPEPRFYIGGIPMFTPGNIGVIQAQAGVGKSNFKAAFIAARICAESKMERDTLGVTANVSPGLFVNIDTEQSPFDHDTQIRRALRRADASSAPDWLRSYGLAGLSAGELRSALVALLWQAAIDGIYTVIIDGVGDLVNDVNDAEECNAFVAELHALAIRYETAIICILHENPGSDNGKGRGHLGSQLMRKAESVLRLVKQDEVTTVFSSKARRAPVLEQSGPRFRWSSDAGMHVSIASTSTLREADSVSDLRDLADEVFSGGRLRWAEACERIEKARRVGEKAGEKWFTRMKKANVIRNVGMGMWEAKAA